MQDKSTMKINHTVTLNNLETQLFELFDVQTQNSVPNKSVVDAILSYAAAFDVVQTRLLGKVNLIKN